MKVVGAGGGIKTIGQYIEMGVVSPLAGQTVTFSARVKTSTASSIRLRLEDSTGGTFGLYHTGGGGWETLTVTRTIGATTTMPVAFMYMDVNDTAYLDNAALVIGSNSNDNYYPLTPEEDMARAQRYYWKTSGVTLFPQVTGNATAGGQTWTTNILFPTPMAVVPTLTKAGTWEVSNMAQPTVDAPSVEGFRLNGTSSAAGFLYSRPDSADDILTAEANP